MSKFLKNYNQPAFLICLTVLLITGVGMNAAVKWAGIYFMKLPLELQKPLDQLDKTALVPYKVVRERKIANKDVLESLGTEMYIEWYLEDPQASANSPTRFCSLFITYYTGDPDPVPHVPEECYVGAGNRRDISDVVIFDLSDIKTSENENNNIPPKINSRYLEFVRDSSSVLSPESRYSVMYFFKTNGAYCATRTETRAILGGNLFSKYSYYSKVEISFSGRNYGGSFYPTKHEAIKACEKLLSVLLPELEKHHWPDCQAANSKEKKQSGNNN